MATPLQEHRNPEAELVRAIGPWALAANTVNTTIGAGIFALPAVVAVILGPAALLAYLLCGALIFLVLTCFVEVGTLVTRSGGAVAYAEEAFGPLVGFLTWVTYALAFSAASDAAIAHVLMDSLAAAFPALIHPLPRAFALTLLFSGLALVNIRGVRHGTRLAIVTTVAKLVPLVSLVAIGLFALTWSNLTWSAWPSVEKFGAATLVLFFSFGGAEAALTPSGEIRDPARTVPRGIFGGAAAIVLLYLALQLVAQGVLGTELASGSSTPLADLAQHLAGPTARAALIACAAVAVFGALAAEMIGIPRTFLAASESGMLPKLLSRIHPRFHTPWISILTFAAITLLTSLSGGFSTLAVFSSISLLLVYLTVCLAALRLRYTRPHSPAGFRAPGGPTVAILASAVVLWLLSHSTRLETLSMTALVAASLLYYWIRRSTLKL